MNQNDVYYIKKHHSRNPGNKGITKMDMLYIDFYLFDISVFIHLFIYLFIIGSNIQQHEYETWDISLSFN